MLGQISSESSVAASGAANGGRSQSAPVYTVEPGTIKLLRELLDSDRAEAVLYLPTCFLKRRPGDIVDSETTLRLGAPHFALGPDEALITACSANESATECIGAVILTAEDGGVTSRFMTLYPTEEDLDGRSVKEYMKSFEGQVALDPAQHRRLREGQTSDGKSALSLLGNGSHPRLMVHTHVGQDRRESSPEEWAGLSKDGLTWLTERLNMGIIPTEKNDVPDEPSTTFRSDTHVPHEDDGSSHEVLLSEDSREGSDLSITVTVLRPGWAPVET